MIALISMCRYAIRLISCITLCILSASAGLLWADAKPYDAAAIEKLKIATSRRATISLARSSGTVSFLKLLPGTLYLKTGVGTTRPAATMAFLDEYGSVFGLQNPAEELELLSQTTDNFGHSHAFYRQVYRGVPVFASDFRSHFDRSGELTRISATTIPVRRLNSIPQLSADQAAEVARFEVIGKLKRRAAPSLDLITEEPELVVFRTGLLRGVPGRNHLAYRVEVRDGIRSVREFVFIDAHTGQVLEQITGIHNSINRKIYNGGLNSDFLVWAEGNDLPFEGPDTTGINNLIDYAEDTYNLFITMSNGTWASFDAVDATMHSVLNNPVISCPNASWNGVSSNFCNGVSGDDTVTHEWAHGYTEYSHNLIYQWQPGALNESFSDIFGEVVDLLNGSGTDFPITNRSPDGSACSILGSGSPAIDNSYRWLAGEDNTAFEGAFRDLWRPECYNDPGKVSSADYWCSNDDGGGVHTNSGVPNHAFSLLVDGGSYNGQEITGLGLIRAAHIYWRAMTIYQGPASNFSAHADALEASCNDLIGADLPAISTDTSIASASGIWITADDCIELSEAISAVELRTDPDQCGFETLLENNPPPRCAGYGDIQSIALTDWEAGLGLWSTGRHDIANPETFDTPDWAMVGILPDNRPGKAAFVANLATVDCSTDNESGALTLDSPAILIPQGVVVSRISIDHWIATEFGYDGGNFKISLNGGDFLLIPASAIEVSPYNRSLASAVEGNTNPLQSQDSFTGADEGDFNGSWGQSQINLYGIAAAGDTIRLRFDFGVDTCLGLTGWYVDDVEFYSCSAEPGPSDCGNGMLDADESCDDGNDFIGDGCSSVCQIEDGWKCTVPVAPGEVADPSFEDGTPNDFWAESSSHFSSPICNLDRCGTGGGTGPLDGIFWVWFGGFPEPLAASVSQSITIPATATELNFGLEVSVCDSQSDYLEVLIDGRQELLIDGSSALCEITAYSTQTVNISNYADDGVHDLEFHSEIFVQNGGPSNFSIDVISMPGTASVCMHEPVSDEVIFISGFESN